MSEVGCVTGKSRFSSRHGATRSRGAKRNKGSKMRAYLCPHCHGWHLTTEVFHRDWRR